jgi:hypothetical protein
MAALKFNIGAIPNRYLPIPRPQTCRFPRLIAKSFMNYWTYATSSGDFSIVERNSRGVDLYFGESFLGHYRNPMAAAEDVGSGSHPTISCAPENGKSLRVPSNLHDWKFSRT